MMMTEERMAGYFRLRANTQTHEVSRLDPTYQGAKLNFTDGKYAVIKVPGRTEWDGSGPLYL